MHNSQFISQFIILFTNSTFVVVVGGQKALSKHANLTMIDLAGSERAKKACAPLVYAYATAPQANTSKKQMREGANINKSLLALANCINALGQKAKGVYIPYR